MSMSLWVVALAGGAAAIWAAVKVVLISRELAPDEKEPDPEPEDTFP